MGWARTDPRARLGAGALLACALVVVTVLLCLPPSLARPVVGVVQLATLTAATVALVRRGRAVEGGLRRGRLLLAAALGSAAVAGAAGAVTDGGAGALRLVAVALAVLGLLALPTSDREPGSSGRCVLDGVVAAVALWFFTWVQLGEQLVAPGAGVLVLLGSPAADVLVMGTLVGVLTRVAPEVRRELELLRSGLGLVLLADAAQAVLAGGPGGRAGTAAALLTQAGLLLVLAAGRSQAEPVPPAPAGVDRWSALPEVCVVAALLAAGNVGLHGAGVDGAPLVAGVLMALLLLARHGVGARDRRALTARLLTREELFRSLVNRGSDLITLSDRRGVLLWASPR